MARSGPGCKRLRAPMAPFQRQVWLMVRRIRAGTTWSYRQLAEGVVAW